ncbi:MAG TPA: AIR synthase-related protein [Acidimicrobiales bacterium]|nr:AIR synthase-related protein [Acidimicrobiales bacterium]
MGKLPSDVLARVLADFGPWPADVLLGPAVGEDACALDVPAGVLVAATDPITLTGREIGRLAVTVNANDVAVMGVRPRWFLATVLMPPGTSEAEVEELFAAMRGALAGVGAVLVGGHTEITDAVNQTVVVGQMLGVAARGDVVSTAGARPGDVVVQVGAAPIEGAAVLVAEATGRLGGLDPEARRVAAGGLEEPGVSVVEAALAAAALGATALHDPTEGGLAAALHELAAAAGVAVRVDRSEVLWSEAGVAVCRALGADPWAVLASGSLLATFDPARAAGAVDALAGLGHVVAAIGTVQAGSGVRDLDDRPIAWPERDEVARLLTP